MLLKRNEIFDVGQHVGMTSSGNLRQPFQDVGKIVDINKYAYANNSYSVQVELISSRGGRHRWQLDKIAEFQLYDDEVDNGIEEK